VILYHVTTPAKVRKYHQTGCILCPVRGFTTEKAAMFWAMKTQRTVILRIDSVGKEAYKLPDHRNQFGEAWWIDSDITKWVCTVSPVPYIKTKESPEG